LILYNLRVSKSPTFGVILRHCMGSLRPTTARLVSRSRLTKKKPAFQLGIQVG